MTSVIPECLEENIPFSSLGAYKIGGVARFVARPRSEEELLEVILWVQNIFLSTYIIGEGTNILMNDDGFPGVLIKPEISFIEHNNNLVRVGAGVSVNDFLGYTIDHNLGGMQWAGGLPGSVGGGVRGNAGCFGGEMKDAIQAVESINIKTGAKKIRNKAECLFEYRSSTFKRESNNQEVIVAAHFLLSDQDGSEVRKISEDHIRYRQERQPLEYPNIGSIFKNVDARKIDNNLLASFEHVIKNDPFPVIPTAYLLSECNLKGMRHGGAAISEKHPNFIVNISRATASDVSFLISHAKSEVRKKFGIEIEPEIIEM